MRFLLDSTVLIRFFQKKEDAVKLIDEKRKDSQAISILSVAEVCAGWTEEQASQMLPDLYRLFEVMPVTTQIAELSGKLRHTYRPKGKTLHTVDTIIAATGIVHGLWVVTFDKDFYPITEVSLLDL